MLHLEKPVGLQYQIRSPFGYRIHPLSGKRRLHRGQDYAAPSGSLIKAAADGVVTKTGSNLNKSSGYGHYIYITHSSTRHLQGYATLYAHLQKPTKLKVGDRVKSGDIIGLVGSTGASTGPHLHFELRKDGKAIDPAPYFGLQSNHLTVNGRFNKATRVAWQQELKRRKCYEGVIDGIIGPMSIRGIQRWYNYNKIRHGTGYSIDYIYVDGILGPITRKAVQRKLNAYPIDGIWGRITISRLQTYLNEVA
jgi:hypothetical protein